MDGPDAGQFLERANRARTAKGDVTIWITAKKAAGTAISVGNPDHGDADPVKRVKWVKWILWHRWLDDLELRSPAYGAEPTRTGVITAVLACRCRC